MTKRLAEANKRINEALFQTDFKRVKKAYEYLVNKGITTLNFDVAVQVFSRCFWTGPIISELAGKKYGCHFYLIVGCQRCLSTATQEKIRSSKSIILTSKLLKNIALRECESSFVLFPFPTHLIDYDRQKNFLVKVLDIILRAAPVDRARLVDLNLEQRLDRLEQRMDLNIPIEPEEPFH